MYKKKLQMFNYQYFNLMHYFFFCCKPNQMSLRPNYTLAAPPRPLNIDTIWYYIEKKSDTHTVFRMSTSTVVLLDK